MQPTQPTLESAFVVETVTRGDETARFRLGRIDVYKNTNIVTPWGAVHTVVDLGAGRSTIDGMCCELLRGEARSHAMNVINAVVAATLPENVLRWFEDATTALLRGTGLEFQPDGKQGWSRFFPRWLELRTMDDNSVRITIVSDNTGRTNDKDVNAAVWQTGHPTWKPAFIAAL